MSAQLFTSPVQGHESDERYTPRWVFDHMGLEFDLDPAHPAEPTFVPTRNFYTSTDDGLSLEWFGLVWCNPPFSNATPWGDRFIAHGNGVFLGPIANAAWWQRMIQAADLVWLCRDFAFHHPTHSGRRSSMPLFLASIGDVASDGLMRLARWGGASRGTLMRKAPTS